MKRILATVLVLVMCFALVACSNSKDKDKDKASGAGSYKDAIENLMGVCYEQKSSKIESLAPDAVWNVLLEEEDITIRDVRDEFEDYYADYSVEDQYGSNVKASFEILEKEKVSDRELEDFKEYLEDNFGISGSKVKTGYSLTVKFTVKGSEDERSYEEDGYVVQIGNLWYPLDASGNFFAEELVDMLF